MNGTLNGESSGVAGLETIMGDGSISLIVDQNGVTIAQAVYRCHACHLLSETLIDAHDHFQVEHGDDPVKNGKVLDDSITADVVKLTPVKTPVKKKATPRRKPAAASAPNNRTKANKATKASKASLGAGSIEDDLAKINESTAQSSPETKVRQYSSSNAGLTHIVCDVCGTQKSYSYYQRRYGAESCVPCSKFFKTFLYDPKEYPCNTNTHDCPLSSDGDLQVCKACRLTACLTTYVTNIDRYPRVVDFLNKTGRSEELDHIREVWKKHIAETGGNGGASNGGRPAGSGGGGGASGTKRKKKSEAPTPSARKRTSKSLETSSPAPTAAAAHSSPSLSNSNKKPKGLSIPSAVTGVGVAGGLKIRPNVGLIKAMPKITFKIKAGSGLLPNIKNRSGLSAISTIAPKRSPSKSSSLGSSALSSAAATSETSPTKSPTRGPPANRKTDNSLAGHLSRGPNCGLCTACTSNDCGSCFHCKDKRKFGGANRIKKKCLKRACVNNAKDVHTATSLLNRHGGGDDIEYDEEELQREDLEYCIDGAADINSLVEGEELIEGEEVITAEEPLNGVVYTQEEQEEELEEEEAAIKTDGEEALEADLDRNAKENNSSIKMEG